MRWEIEISQEKQPNISRIFKATLKITEGCFKNSSSFDVTIHSIHLHIYLLYVKCHRDQIDNQKRRRKCSLIIYSKGKLQRMEIRFSRYTF